MSRPPSGQGANWDRIRARRAEEAADAAAEKLVAAFKAELAAQDPNELFAVAVSAAMTANPAHASHLGGQRTPGQKARIMDAWQAERDAHWARHGRGYSIVRPGQPPVYASAAAPGEVSPLLLRLYGIS
jgi:hypothetical protein